MKDPTIGIALGSGGARGFAHIGVLQVLEEAGIPVDLIAGSSMGSLVGAFYATGIEIKYMEQIAIHLKRRHWLDFTVPKMGFVTGTKLLEMVRFVTRDLTFEEAKIPLSIVATDLETGERIVFQEGPIYKAVRASISIPGIFVPVRIDGRLCVDGGVIDRVPISTCRNMGADIVIAVDVGLYDHKAEVKDIIGVFLQTFEIMERELVKYRIIDADVLIRPDVGFVSSTSFTNIEECIERGRLAAREALPAIREKILNWDGRKEA